MTLFKMMYLKDLENDKIQITDGVNDEVKSKMDDLQTKYQFPQELYELYLKNNSLQSSIVINETYYSVDIEEICKLREYYPHFIDFFYRYIGMGNMEFISMCIYSKKFFLRRAGGNNDFEREENYTKYQKQSNIKLYFH